ncbi:MAG: ferrous iron transport protein A [candidate division Zixibacteria bacterium]
MSSMTKFDQLNLSETKVGKTYQLVSLDGGFKLREKIASMGLNSGTYFTIIANSGHGPVGLEVRCTRLGIGRGAAIKIKVKEVEFG